MKIYITNHNILIIVALQFFSIAIGISQTIAVENTRQQIAYPWIDNPLTIVVEGIPCDQIAVTTNNGKMVRQNGCLYIFTPMQVGIASLLIYKVSGKDSVLLGERKYRIKSLPIPEAEIGGKKSGTMGNGEFKAQSGIIVPINFNDIDGRYSIESFRMQIIRKGEVIASLVNNTGVFQEKTRTAIDEVRPGDKVFFDQIQIRMPGEEGSIKLNTIAIDIK